MFSELCIRPLQSRTDVVAGVIGVAAVTEQKSQLSPSCTESSNLLLSTGQVLLNVLADEFSMLNNDMDHRNKSKHPSSLLNFSITF